MNLSSLLGEESPFHLPHGISHLHHLRGAHTGYHLHHLLCLVELFEEFVYLLYVCSGTLCNTSSSRSVYNLGILPLLWSHGSYDGLNVLERIVRYVNILNSLSYSRYHSCEVLYISHLLDLLYLPEEVIEVKLVLPYFLLETFSLLLVKLLLGTLNERDDVAHAENTVGHTFWMEDIDGLHLFSCAYELDRFVDNSPDRQSCATTCIAIKFCQDNTVNLKSLIEDFRCGDSFLAYHGVYDKQGLLWQDSILDVTYLYHQFLVDRLSAGGIDDHDIVTVELGMVDGVSCYKDRVCRSLLNLYRDIDLSCKYA